MSPAPKTATVSTFLAGAPYLLCFNTVTPATKHKAYERVYHSVRPYTAGPDTSPVKMPRRAADTEVAANSAKRVASYFSASSLLWLYVKPGEPGRHSSTNEYHKYESAALTVSVNCPSLLDTGQAFTYLKPYLMQSRMALGAG